MGDNCRNCENASELTAPVGAESWLMSVSGLNV